ncbi:hypothetical protein AU152_gp59 [Mycobacterium phage Phlei]|uniref:Uncharacterized protein n=1 Tax=Mycobacterium phage Phlei TaxID=1690684 RepID=A0A0N9BDS0_9CAUD|nr:hypothetical protein AU152_gp59 [Mycobacterium phage Phlei]ALA48172.1 hypothetical protein [Mycobacterium phage Phlei]
MRLLLRSDTQEERFELCQLLDPVLVEGQGMKIRCSTAVLILLDEAYRQMSNFTHKLKEMMT